jgi:hypothetical protein
MDRNKLWKDFEERCALVRKPDPRWYDVSLKKEELEVRFGCQNGALLWLLGETRSGSRIWMEKNSQGEILSELD